MTDNATNPEHTRLTVSTAKDRRFLKVFFLSLFVFSLCIFAWKRADLFPWIGGCNASGYSDSNFMAYCHSTRYGDIEHKLFWENRIPGMLDHVKSAKVLFLGNSRTQYAFSTRPVSEFFEQHAIKHYVFGFGMGSQNKVPELMAEKYGISPKALVINADPFFTDRMSNTVENMLKQSAEKDWETDRKMTLQSLQRTVCSQNDSNPWYKSFLCNGKNETLYRRPLDGHWEVDYFRANKRIPVAVENRQNLHVSLDKATQIAETFFEKLGVDKSCVFITVTPRTQTPLEFAQLLAEALGVHGAFPWSDEYLTIDDSHLDPPSADHWSARLIQDIATPLLHCVAE